MSASSLHRRLLLSTTMLIGALTAYGRSAYAQIVCLPNPASPVFLCNGFSDDTQVLTGINNAAVTTGPNFAVDTTLPGGSGGNAITITGDGALSYRDYNASPLTAARGALFIMATGNDGPTPGSVTVNTDGTLTGGVYGIYAQNFGAGWIEITTNGDVTGTNRRAIYAFNSFYSDYGIAITTQRVTGSDIGIIARNDGAGAIVITAHGTVTSTDNGVVALNGSYSDYGIAITTQRVTAGSHGISADNNGRGALVITAHGTVTGTTDDGILAFNSSNSEYGIAITSQRVTGGIDGIYARNYGSGAIEITAHGTVTGTQVHGIYAWNSSNSEYGIAITTQRVTGGLRGIDAVNVGAGALTIEAKGDVEGTGGLSTGIYAAKFNVLGTGPLSITSEGVTGGENGIRAFNFGSGALAITAKGNVEGTGFIGIDAYNSAYSTEGLTIESQGVSGGFRGIDARNFGIGALTITAKGDVVAGTGNGIYAQQLNAAATGPLSITSEGVTGGNGIVARNEGTGALTIEANGDVKATGGLSTGIFAGNNNVNSTTNLTVTSQSVTGGGWGIFATNSGKGAISVTAHGDVVGSSFDGIFAWNFNNTATGPVSVISNGKVTGNRFGIYAVTYGTGPVSVTVGSGATVTGGTAGVRFIGASDTLNNFGSVRNLAGVAGTAILSTSGNGTVNNFGIVTGNVLLSPVGANVFNNMEGGLFNSGPTVFLGTDNTLTNHGTLAPGGVGTVLTTVLTGDLTQPGSTFAVDLNASLADKVEVSGNASMAGLVRPNILNLDGTTRWTIMTSATGPIDAGIAVNDTLIVDYELLFPSDTQMDLLIAGVDFAVSGLNRNEAAIAENLNDVFVAGNFPKLESLLTALANLQSVGDLAGALDQLSPEVYLDQGIATLFASLNFANSLMTCPTRDGAAAFIKEGQCVWARVSGREFNQVQTTQTIGFEEDSFEVAGGMQGALGEVWRVGFAGAYERALLDTDSNASSDADRIHGGAVVKYNPGPLLLAAAVSGGWGWYDTDRRIAIPGFFAQASSDNDISYVDGRLRAEYLLSNGSWYAKPMVDLDATHVSLDGVNETGSGGMGLNVRGSDETVFSATPALELGAQFGNPNGTLVRPYVRGGATLFDDPDFVLLASFDGAPSGVGPFRIAANTDDVVANVGAGLDVLGTDGTSFRLYYEGRFGDTVEQHAAGIKGTLPF